MLYRQVLGLGFRPFYLEWGCRRFRVMAATNVKGRLVADPSIGLSDLMGPLRSFAQKLDPNAESNLLDLLAVPKGVTWKTAIHPEWLTHLGKLYEAQTLNFINTLHSLLKARPQILKRRSLQSNPKTWTLQPLLCPVSGVRPKRTGPFKEPPKGNP